MVVGGAATPDFQGIGMENFPFWTQQHILAKADKHKTTLSWHSPTNQVKIGVWGEN